MDCRSPEAAESMTQMNDNLAECLLVVPLEDLSQHVCHISSVIVIGCTEEKKYFKKSKRVISAGRGRAGYESISSLVHTESLLLCQSNVVFLSTRLCSISHRRTHSAHIARRSVEYAELLTQFPLCFVFSFFSQLLHFGTARGGVGRK